VKILFLVRSLNYGGAERQLILLSKGLCERGHHVTVACFYSGGPLEKELKGTHVQTRPLNKRGRWDIFSVLLRLARLLREERPDILHGYLFDPNLLTAFLKPLFPHLKIVWGVRTSMLDFSRYDWVARLSFKLNRWLSRVPDIIIANSHVGRDYHVSLGYPAEKTVVIPNGIDTERFRPNPEARDRIRSEWGVDGHEKLIGIVGRLHPMKDHPIFLQAAALLVQHHKNRRFVCVGSGPTDYRATLQTLAERLGLSKRLLWVEAREDMPDVYNAFDVSVSCSYGEGLSNVICEAMACGVPCVVTDVGDSAWVVGERDWVVPPKDPEALKHAVERVLDRASYSPAQLRQRIMDGLSIANLVTETERTLSGLVPRSVGRQTFPNKVPLGAAGPWESEKPSTPDC
jgi:glycosyltransferase involved in cell wall biosynthesis